VESIELNLMRRVTHPNAAVTDWQSDAPDLASACASCHTRAQCLPAGLSSAQLGRISRLVSGHRKVKRGETLLREGEAATQLYAVRSGFLKTQVASQDGHEQVTGFHMAGELLGLEGLSREQHTAEVVALEDAEVCVLPIGPLQALAQEIPALQSHLFKLLSQEIVRERQLILLLGNTRADERVARFLLDLTQRLQARGLSASEHVLRMTREEMGSYLSLKLETVSRTFSKLAADGVLSVKHRHLHIHDPEALVRIAQGKVTSTTSEPPKPRVAALPRTSVSGAASAWLERGLFGSRASATASWAPQPVGAC